MSQIERRSFELRADSNNFEIYARAIKYNATATIGGQFQERIAPGAFSDSINRGDEVVCLLSHLDSEILGRTRNGTLALEDGPDALRFRCKLNKNVQAHRDMYELVKAGTISECSFSFSVDDQDWDNSQKPPLRTVKHGTLYDVSLVSQPAYGNGATSAEARRRAAVAAPPAKPTAKAIETVRKSVRALARSLRGWMDQTDFASVNPHQNAVDQAAFAHQCTEAACAAFGQARDFWKDFPGDDDYDDDLYDDPDFDRACRMAAAHLDYACEHMAAASLHHARMTAKRKK